MSRDYQEKFLTEQIAEYDQLLLEHAADKGTNRNLIKTIEKQKAARCERLKDLLAEDKKDDGLVFDELGVDHVFIDEAHYFKNLETPTKMERVAGIQTGGSERAFDLYMKCHYLDQPVLVPTSFTSVRTEADLIPWPRPRRGATGVEERGGALDAWVTSHDR
jgi:N12 class adenine-specific DNA methylase